VVLWIVAAYMKLVVVYALHMKLGMMSVVYVRLIVELLVQTVNMRFVALPFADYSLDHCPALMIAPSPGNAPVLTSLMVPASLGQSSCSIAALFDHVSFPFVTILVPCL
jgi:hypothetical protein